MISFRLEETPHGRNVMILSKLMWMETPGRHASDRSIPRSLRQEASMGEPVSHMWSKMHHPNPDQVTEAYVPIRINRKVWHINQEIQVEILKKKQGWGVVQKGSWMPVCHRPRVNPDQERADKWEEINLDKWTSLTDLVGNCPGKILGGARN